MESFRIMLVRQLMDRRSQLFRGWVPKACGGGVVVFIRLRAIANAGPDAESITLRAEIKTNGQVAEISVPEQVSLGRHDVAMATACVRKADGGF